MKPFAARCLLVGSAMVLLAAGVAAPLAGASRVTVIGAAGTCAVLDLLLARAVRSGHDDDVAVLGPPAADAAAAAPAPDAAAAAAAIGADAVAGARTLDAVAGARATGAAAAAPATGGTTASTADVHGPTRGPAPCIVLGTAPDGSTVELDGRPPEHVVIAGRGVLALAVFRAVATQLRAAARDSGAVVRIASAPDLRPLLARDGEACPSLPDGAAVLVTDPARGHCRTSVVLVSDPGAWPRRWDVVVEVSRYGCSVRRRHGPRGTPVSPVLPRLAE